MNETSRIQQQVDNTVSALKVNILRYYDALHELRRLTLLLLDINTPTNFDIDRWLDRRGFGICPDGFWQSLQDLNAHRRGSLDPNGISFSCHPDIRHDPAVRHCIYAHRHVGRYLKEIRSRLPGSAWLYYQDVTNMALQYPFIDQISAIPPDFDWSGYHTWVSVSPENNPERSIQWTAPSIDYAGEGLIISVSIPIYRGNRFQGLWSIDLPMAQLYQQYMDEIHIPEQENVIIDAKGILIAHPRLKARIDSEKGTVFHENIQAMGEDLGRLNLKKMVSESQGHRSITMADQRRWDLYFKVIPEIDWIYFSLFPRDRMIDVIHRNISTALDRVRRGDFSYRLKHLPDDVGTHRLVTGFNDMARAIEAQQAQLIESQKRIVQAEKMSAIGTLAGGIAHDFNNILSSILGFSELALDRIEPGSDLESDLREIHHAGKRARDLIKQILAFARQSDDDIQPVSPASIAGEVMKLIRPSTPSDIEIRTRIHSREMVMGNVISLHQILMNLCTNAAHAMEKKGGVLEMDIRDVVIKAGETAPLKDLSPGTWVYIQVSDSGSGISSDILERIFEPYFTTKPQGKGTGMGLSMVKDIVERYKGHITAESIPGNCSTFSIYLPAYISGTQQEETPSPEIPMGTESLLLVDDEPAVARISGLLLERLGYTVTVKNSSLEALDLVRSRPHDFDLVITDMTMPHMTGDTLAEKIMVIRPEIPVIMMTGHSSRISEKEACKIGIRAFANKPLLREELAGIIRKVLD